MSGQSNVGNSGVYQADDQRTVSDATIEQEKKENRFHEGKEHSHQATDSSMFIPTYNFTLFTILNHPSNNTYLAQCFTIPPRHAS
jgi:hypothetical protein